MDSSLTSVFFYFIFFISFFVLKTLQEKKVYRTSSKTVSVSDLQKILFDDNNLKPTHTILGFFVRFFFQDPAERVLSPPPPCTGLTAQFFLNKLFIGL